MPVVDGYAAQMQRGIDFIEEHLDEDIELAEVARRAGISRWHFHRIFKALTHETLKTYIRGRRLAHALRKLLETDERIIEIALAATAAAQGPNFLLTYSQVETTLSGSNGTSLAVLNPMAPRAVMHSAFHAHGSCSRRMAVGTLPPMFTRMGSRSLPSPV